MTWRKSSYSGNGGGECVEIAAAGTVVVRDSKDAGGPVLSFSATAWEAFTAGLKKLAGCSTSVVRDKGG